MHSKSTKFHIQKVMSVFLMTLCLLIIDKSLYSQADIYDISSVSTISSPSHSKLIPTGFISSDTLMTSINDSTLYREGIVDAKLNYNAAPDFAFSFIPSAFFPPAGLGFALFKTFAKPKIYQLGIPMTKKYLIPNDDYFAGYYEKANAKKTTYSWTGFITGSAFFVCLLVFSGHIYDLPFIK
jgi:hypothetical protein